jgi:CHAT domain-containing protein
MRCAILVELDRREEALAAFRDCEANLHPDLAADMLLRLGDPQGAREQLALLDSSGWAPPPAKVWQDVTRRAEVALQLGNPGDAATLATRAIDEFERQQALLAREPLRSWSTDQPAVASLYHVGTRAHLALADRGQAPAESAAITAFDLADRSRGVFTKTLTALRSLETPQQRQVARDWLRAGVAWAAAYEGLFDQVTRDPDVMPEPAELQRQLLAVEDRLDEAEGDLERVAPNLMRAGREPRAPLTLAGITDALPDDTVLLFYQALRDDLVVWGVSGSRVEYHQSRIQARSLGSDARRFHSHCAAGEPDDGVGDALAAALLAPMGDTLNKARRLLVVPHGALSLLPFHALPWNGGSLSEGRIISYLPAAALLTQLGGSQRVRLDQPALLVGDPAYAPGRPLRRLPGTHTEVAVIANLLGAPKPLTNTAATAAAVLSQAPERPILHLATHGYVNERAPHRNHLALAGWDSVNVADLMGLDLGAELVVLSACHTGRGTATAGGDVIGLVRAALTAGAQHIVVSLWPVDDLAGCVLMAEMYKALQNNNGDVAAALAATQDALRPQSRSEWYAKYDELARAANVSAPAAGIRDAGTLSADDSPRPSGAYYWAPFIHVGL